MKARLHDPPRPSVLPLLVLLVALAMIVVPHVVASAAPFATLGLGLGAQVALLAGLWSARSRPVDVDVRLGFGWIEVREGKRPWRRLEGGGMGGARIARGAEGASLAIAHGWGPPILLELRDEADARAVQVALGVPPGESGEIGWAMERSFLERAGRSAFGIGLLAAMVLFAIGLAPYAGFRRLPLPEVMTILTTVALGCAVASPLLRWLGAKLRPKLGLEKDGLRLGRGQRAPVVPYVLIQGAKLVPGGLELQLKSLDDKVANHPRIVPLTGLSSIERAHVLAHVRSSAREAQGWGRGRRAQTVRTLSRAEGEPVAGWLGRLDRMVPSQPGAPYRESVPDAKELAHMIDDPASPRDLRIAAVRVLARLDPETARRRVADLEARADGDEDAARIHAAALAEHEAAAEAYEAMRPAFRVVDG